MYAANDILCAVRETLGNYYPQEKPETSSFTQALGNILVENHQDQLRSLVMALLCSPGLMVCRMANSPNFSTKNAMSQENPLIQENKESCSPKLILETVTELSLKTILV